MSGENVVEITVRVNVEEGRQILEKIFEILKIKRSIPIPTKVVQWPYWCWNCRLKIEKETDAVKGKGDVLECPSCGVQMPEP